MHGIALMIVLAAAFLHATWNYLAKKSRHKIVFIWWFILAALVIYLPMFLYCWPQAILTGRGRVYIAASGLLHFFYFWFLGGAYERGELSTVYPLSRGSGPLFVPVLAVVMIHEQLHVVGVGGILLVIVGIYIIHLPAFSRRAALQPFLAMRGGGSLWALLTGLTIAAYSIVDKVGVSLVDPPVYIYLMLWITWLMLTPCVIAGSRQWIKSEWACNRWSILWVGFLVLFTYMMVLFAMQMARVSYVVAVREVSIFFSALYGLFWLQERHVAQKLTGAGIITFGVILIGVSR